MSTLPVRGVEIFDGPPYLIVVLDLWIPQVTPQGAPSAMSIEYDIRYDVKIRDPGSTRDVRNGYELSVSMRRDNSKLLPLTHRREQAQRTFFTSTIASNSADYTCSQQKHHFDFNNTLQHISIVSSITATHDNGA
jgi:hypothetical protein